ncbi:coproporphyrinogen III oxidase [Clostridium ganghwense]|uniref:Coproporphyrinogen III oxidase n=1 Tax=Clostridium ganghwense TaxID=312089 RepID=A0ABT4CPT6_9CLOT|nr:coproporphyrinogen III oxidase [Clostridium ganghwense]MCY6370453.1 coproporphyrinogen III oxidase [Clostridium ganghwense]
MVKIKLNDFKYRYDVYHMFNLFYNFNNIEFVEEDYDFHVTILEEKIEIFDKDEQLACFEIYEDFKKNDQVKGAIFKYLREKTGKELPWGVLIGIRPTKKVLDFMDQGKSEQDILRSFIENSFVREDKARLCIDIAKVERKNVNKDKKSISVYIGMPFCPTRCLYCSFTSNPISSCKKIVDDYLTTLNHEIQVMKKFIDEKNLKIECVYFGGGTPTSISEKQFESTLFNIYDNFVKGRNVREFNVECGRPDSINAAKLSSMKKFGVNRISINPQSMNNDTLKSIGRNHTVEDVINKFNLARKLGFDNINMDIIVGLPNEGLEQVRNTCSELLKLNPDSITVHGMSVKRASKLHEQIVTGVFNIREQKELNAMYEETVKLSKELGMKPYYMYRQKNMVGNMENVGYAKPSKEGIYNIEMIEEKQTIIALGADAVTKVVFLDDNRMERFPNIKDVREYIKRIDEKIEKKIEILETLY